MEQHSQEQMSVENWVRIQQNQQPKSQNDDVEAISLCDLPTNEPDHSEHSNPQKQPLFDEPQPDFAFGSSSISSQPDNNMSSADELFFRGQILPLRHSVTLPSRFITRPDEFIFTRSISVSISEPVSAATSRSSSARSSTSVSEFNGYRTQTQTRNQFHSHPSPTPHIRTRIRNFRQSNKQLSKWRLLQLGPLKHEEIGLMDLKNRSRRGNMMRDEEDKKKHVLSFAGCKCSTDVIESTVSSRISMVKPMTLNEEETESKDSDVGRRKHVVSGHRTIEWLKQLLV